MKSIKVINQAFMTTNGLARSYGLVINGIPVREFYDENEVADFIRELYGVKV